MTKGYYKHHFHIIRIILEHFNAWIIIFIKQPSPKSDLHTGSQCLKLLQLDIALQARFAQKEAKMMYMRLNKR